MSADTPNANFWEFPDSIVTGAWAEKRALAEALRELVALCQTTDAPEAALEAAREGLVAVADHLRPHPRRTFKDAYATLSTHADFAEFADRGTLVGRCNPVAPPMTLVTEGDTAVGLVTFGPPYEGAPGFVHGGIVAAALDQVFGFVQVRRGISSLTGSLSVKYLRPTPLSTPLRFEAHLDRVDGRRSHLVGRVLVGGHVTAEAEAVFIAVESLRLQAVFADRSDSVGGSLGATRGAPSSTTDSLGDEAQPSPDPKAPGRTEA